MNRDEAKRRAEVESVLALDAAAGLGLRDVRSTSADPPDVEAALGGKRIGIEVTESVESDEAATEPLFKAAVIPEIQRLAAVAAPGQVLLSTEGLVMPTKRAQLQQLAQQLADVVIALAAQAKSPGATASAAAGVYRAVLEGRRKDFCEHVRLPLGIGHVDFERFAEGSLQVIYTGGVGIPIAGAGLETTAERVKTKAARLTSWPPYDERWLLVTAFRFTRTSAMQARLDRQRFSTTGFDQIWLLDAFHPIGQRDEDSLCNAVRLDCG
jgi:hypothetical protein